MDSETLEKIKRQYSVLAPNRILDLVAEVERLHKEIDEVLNYYDMRIGDFEKEVERLQAENEQLKEVLYTLYTRLHKYEDGSWAEINFNLWQSLMDCQLLAQLVETSEAYKGKWEPKQ